jgi:hypothetical protein
MDILNLLIADYLIVSPLLHLKIPQPDLEIALKNIGSRISVLLVLGGRELNDFGVSGIRDCEVIFLTCFLHVEGFTICRFRGIILSS